ncbi:MAG: DUF732 domain-containing protein [Actinomycetota bacterium]|nr:DUF732 domain-containing protein [Actinomycetota bacterium]
MTSRSSLFAILAANAVTGLAVAAAIAIAPAHASPCTEDCGEGQAQYMMNDLRAGGVDPGNVQYAVTRAKAICSRLNAGATRDQVRSTAGDGSDRQTDIVINAAIKYYCPGVKA